MKAKLLLLHGALGTKDQFRTLKEKLSDVFEVHDIDFEGHGAKESSKDFSMDLFVENVVTYLELNLIEMINIFGYSMGGYVGLKLAIKYPTKVGKIMTLGTKFNWTETSAAQEIRMLNPEKIEEKIPSFANKLASIHTNNNWKEVMIKTAKMMYQLGQGDNVTSQELEQIKHEVLIGIGSEDRMVSIEESKKSVGLLQNGMLKVIEGFQHPIEKNDADELSSIIVDMMKNR
ncbi:MAG: esterase/lipase [Saprospiraceae bacterium]|jgi:esterase/lipase|tara:strand:- start:344 stop:1036 length:693 start_codon:yes stop_codon:yes gene_type:complete